VAGAAVRVQVYRQAWGHVAGAVVSVQLYRHVVLGPVRKSSVQV